MDQKERARKDIDKLERIVKIFKDLKLDKKYPKITEYVNNYGADAKHFYEKEDYFTAFGAANYAYGFIDAILVIEGKKDEIIL